jgi:hypothetical protein
LEEWGCDLVEKRGVPLCGEAGGCRGLGKREEGCRGCDG